MHQGEKAKELREARGWTQQDLRDRLEKTTGRKISRPSISQMEDRKWLEGDLIADLLKVFGATPNAFFETPPPTVETREEAMSRAFQFIRSDTSIQVGGTRTARWPDDAKLAIIRLYEKFTGKRLLSEDIL